IVALIPARFGATRFPAKLLAELCGKSLVARTFLSTVVIGVFYEFIVVMDHHDFSAKIEAVGGRVLMSQQEHESGSDRIAEAVRDMEADIVVNVQGDEPFQDRKSLKDLVDVFKNDQVMVSSMMSRIHNNEEIQSPNAV